MQRCALPSNRVHRGRCFASASLFRVSNAFVQSGGVMSLAEEHLGRHHSFGGIIGLLKNSLRSASSCRKLLSSSNLLLLLTARCSW